MSGLVVIKRFGSSFVQGSPYWEIAAGYVGALKAEIPFTNLYSQAVSLTLDEALLTIRPRSKGSAPPRPAAAADEASGSPGVGVCCTLVQD